MTHVLSIIAHPENPVIDQAFLGRLAKIFHEGEIIELAKGVAYDIPVSAQDQDTFLLAHEARHGLPADVNIVPLAHRRKKLLIADMDSTIIEQECIDELAEQIGKRAEIAAITERAMHGELNFEDALKERVAMLAGLSESALLETYEKRISLTPGAKTLVQTMNAKGAMTALVSGGFTFFTEKVARLAGFQTTQANILVIENGKLTGKVKEPILGRAAKQNALLKLAGEHGLALEDTLAVGDGANDLSMLERAGLGVAFHAKPAVAENANACISHGDLTALLYLQGIPQSEFVSD